MDSEEENNYLKALINSKYTYTADVPAFFTGFTDIDTEGAWVEHGSNNQMVFPPDWYMDEPNGGTTENCLVFYFPDLKWVDFPCSSEQIMICEMDAPA
ncbi:C-type lectin domain family 3 member A-like [Ruditapes philippinarum]|uniref:C-type lectin domain family 3 member A-like n=1 Tax=Ruditapes philippinarum TaxID=129788 RepID=UPI00295B9793|nr:C-type lectin domain family 3 member A-like [Ruditapes philippinarum]